MAIQLRTTTTKDFKDTEFLTREAFWDVYKPGCDEHFVLYKIRTSNCYIPELDIVAELEGKIIGHIICTKAKIIDTSGKEYFTLCVGPLSVNPEYQKQGYGAQLMEYCIRKAYDMGYSGMILFGNPAYYHRFGFVNAAEFQITTKDGDNFEPFMAKELTKEGFQGISGRFYEDKVFSSDEEGLLLFEKDFPYREKHVLPTQLWS